MIKMSIGIALFLKGRERGNLDNFVIHMKCQ